MFTDPIWCLLVLWWGYLLPIDRWTHTHTHTQAHIHTNTQTSSQRYKHRRSTLTTITYSYVKMIPLCPYAFYLSHAGGTSPVEKQKHRISLTNLSTSSLVHPTSRDRQKMIKYNSKISQKPMYQYKIQNTNIELEYIETDPISFYFRSVENYFENTKYSLKYLVTKYIGFRPLKGHWNTNDKILKGIEILISNTILPISAYKPIGASHNTTVSNKQGRPQA